jgi:thioredoxin-dependent peroxiredoxin
MEAAMERKGLVTFAGKTLTLTGSEVKVGDKAPDFTAIDKDLSVVRMHDFAGKVKIISVTPSLDTPVCDLQARQFEEEAGALGEKAAVINMSMDLPFAIARFCAGAGIKNIRTLSDHRDASFGNAYGVLIKELRLLSRSVFVIDRSDIIRYIELVPEITNEPDFERAIAEAKKLI